MDMQEENKQVEIDSEKEDDDDDDLDSDEEDEEESARKPEKWKNHYSSNHRILFVGEGDFSFSLCLARAFGSAHNLVATSLDSQREWKKRKKKEPFP